MRARSPSAFRRALGAPLCGPAALLAWLLALLASLGALERACGQPAPFFKLPNPFEASANSYYSIRSLQSSLSAHRKRAQVDVLEVFSLENGHSFSLHVDSDEPALAYALLGDGPRGRSYVVRNLEPQLMSLAKADCQLDHRHHHRQLFPWQYSFDVAPDKGAPNATKARRRNNKWAKRRSIYGVGAIWLNAVELEIVSDKVGPNSPYDTSNLWRMSHADTQVELLFDKPAGRPDSLDEQLLAKSSLNSVQVRRAKSCEHSDDFGGTLTTEAAQDIITVTDFQAGLKAGESALLGQFFLLLNKCRQSTKQQRVFPSLMRALALSPSRAIGLSYVQRRYRLAGEPKGDLARDKRQLHQRELNTEWLSLQLEAQATEYEAMPEALDADQGDEGQAEGASVGDVASDVFLKRFTDGEHGRSSRHSTVHYHWLNYAAPEQPASCIRGEREPPPSDPMFIRPLHFGRADGRRLSGQLTGLLALLLNAADVHYAEFSLWRRSIGRLVDPFRSGALEKVEVDEWRFTDTKSGRGYHFYFWAKPEADQHTVADLVRVDVRDERIANPNPDVADEPSAEIEHDYNLLMRYDLLDLSAELDERDIDIMLRVPDFCAPEPKPDKPDGDKDDDDHDDSDKDSDGDTDDSEGPFDEDDFDHMFDEYHDDQDSDSDSDAAGQSPNRPHQEHLELEFEPGFDASSVQFPEFFQLIEGAAAYEIITQIRVLPPPSTKDVPAKQLFLQERVDLARGQSMLQLYYSLSSLGARQPDYTLYINHNSGAVFGDDLKRCRLLEEPDSWLRLLSAKLEHYSTPEGAPKPAVRPLPRVSDKAIFYGMGALLRQMSASSFTEFKGAKRASFRDEHQREVRELVWSYSDDSDMLLDVTFQFNLDKHRNNKHAPLVEYLVRDKVQVKLSHLFHEESQTQFSKFLFETIHLQPLQVGPAWTLPPECRRASSDFNRRRHEVGLDRPSVELMPMFGDFVANKQGYTFSYSLFQSTETESIGMSRVLETCDYVNGLARLEFSTGNTRRVIFVDGKRDKIVAYLPHTNQCKLLARVEPLMKLDEPSTPPNQGDKSKAFCTTFGLAAIWSQLELAKVSMVSVEPKHDMAGNSYNMYVYKLFGGGSEAGRSSHKYTLKLTFRGSLNQASRAADRQALEIVELEPNYHQKLKSLVPDHARRIKLLLLSTRDKADMSMDMPKECSELLAGGNQPTPGPEPDQASTKAPVKGPDPMFPSIYSVIGSTRQFYMRSEVTSSQPLFGDSKQVFLVDEWYDHGRMRLSTHGLKRDVELLMRPDTKKAFEFGLKYSCSGQLPELDSAKLVEPYEMLRFWASTVDKSDQFELDSTRLAHFYYAPMALWFLASLPGASVELASSVNCLPDLANSLNHFGQMEREMRLESWRVTLAGGKLSRSYVLEFERMARKIEGTLKTWPVLSKVSVEDTDAGRKLKQTVNVEVANYRYTFAPGELERQLMAPQGYGCQGGPDSRSVDEFDLRSPHTRSFWYEASLEYLSGNGGPSQSSPTLLGTFASMDLAVLMSDEEPPMKSRPVTLHTSRLRFADGTLASLRDVYDEQFSNVYSLDQSSGACRLFPVNQGYPWTLNAPVANSLESVQLDELKLEIFFGNTESQQFALINEYVDSNQWLVREYEKSLPQLALTSSVSGPASIIRTFRLDLSSAIAFSKQQTSIENKPMTLGHSLVEVRVLVFDERRTRKRAEFNMALAKLPLSRLPELVQHSNVAACYNDGSHHSERQMARFELEYVLSSVGASLSQLQFEQGVLGVEKAVLGMLLSGRAGIPLDLFQIAGLPRVEQAHSGHLVVRFELLDAPTAIERFEKRWGSAMADQLAALAEVKPVASLDECSRWCDRLNCLALSHCSDRTCRVLSANMLVRGGRGRKLATAADDSRVANALCTYYFEAKGAAPVTRLAKFASAMSTWVNSRRKLEQLRHYSLEVKKQTLLPFKFRQLPANLAASADSANSELEEEEEEELDGPQGRARPGYRVYKLNQRLVIDDLNQLVAGSERHKHLQVGSGFRNNMPECLRECGDKNCAVVSFCDSTKICVTLAAGSGSFELKSLDKLAVLADQAGCVTVARDTSVNYKLFANTQRPASSQLQLNQLTTMECASACDAAADMELQLAPPADQAAATPAPPAPFVCLSFDFCAPDYEPLGSCYLQSSHVMLDDFDRSILMPQLPAGSVNASGQPAEAGSVDCAHYSKSVLADFRLFRNSRLARRTSELVRGSSAEQCAIECQRDEQCHAYQHCFIDKIRPANLCYFLRQNDALELGFKDLSLASISGQLSYSKVCSVYARRTSLHASYKLDPQTHKLTWFDAVQRLRPQNRLLHSLLVMAGWALAALAVGSLLQVLIIKLIGRPLTYSRA